MGDACCGDTQAIADRQKSLGSEGLGSGNFSLGEPRGTSLQRSRRLDS